MGVGRGAGRMEYPNTTDDLDDLVGVELVGHRPDWRFRIEKRLGGGAQGNAFLARRLTDQGDDPAVVKVWRPSFVLAHQEIARLVLKKEYVALARLNDRIPPTPFVVRLVEGGEVTVRMRFTAVVLPWLALEYVHGGALGTNLGERIRESVATNGAAPPPARVRRILAGIVEGIVAIHEVGVVHRDLKPTNVLVCGVGEDELAKVADFGLSRPMGMQSTFGELAVGTPGYAAPEQMDAAKVGPWSDVFSLAAIAYFVVSGEDMFEGAPTVRMANVYSGRFTPLTERSRVHADWTKGALARIENVLRRATHRDLSTRLPSVDDFWRLLEPILNDAESAGSHSIAAGSARTLKDASFAPWAFQLRHRQDKPLGLRSVAFDPDGHGLATGTTGLWFWEGSQWVSMPPPQGLDAAGLHHLRRLGPTRWLGCGEGGAITVFSPTACHIHQRLGDGSLTLTTASVLSERRFAVAGRSPGGAPVVLACLDGAWTRPLTVDFAADVTAMAPAGVGAWHLVGADAGGHGVFATWRADTGAIERWPIESAPLMAAVTDATGTTFAVGAGGYAFRKREGHPALERVFSHRDLSCVAVDPAGGLWAAAVGRILRRAPILVGDWSPVWSDNAWTTRFVSIAALAGLVMAAAEDGSIVVGHQGLAV